MSQFKAVVKILGFWLIYHVLSRGVNALNLKLVFRNGEPASEVISILLSFATTFLGYKIFVKRFDLQALPLFLRRKIHSSFWVFSLLFFVWMFLYLGNIRYSWADVSAIWFKDFLIYTKVHFFEHFSSEFQEEVAYRGLLFAFLLTVVSRRWAIVGQAVVFLLFHYVGVLHGRMDLWRSLSTFILGFIFMGIAESTGGLIIPTLFHFLWNLISTFLYLQFES